MQYTQIQNEQNVIESMINMVKDNGGLIKYSDGICAPSFWNTNFEMGQIVFNAISNNENYTHLNYIIISADIPSSQAQSNQETAVTIH